MLRLALRTLLAPALVLLLVPAARAADFFVSTKGDDKNAGTQAAPWRTVTHAAKTAPSGSRIVIAAGSYGGTGFAEGLEVSGGKQLELVGAGPARTRILANASFAPTIPYRTGSRAWNCVLAVHGAGTRVELRGLSLDAARLPVAGPLTTAIYTDGASGVLEAVHLVGAGAATPNGAQSHVGFVAIGKDAQTAAAVTLRRCRITGWNKTGVYMSGLGLTGVLQGCEILGAGLLGTGLLGAGQPAQNAVQLEEGARYELVDNRIGDVDYEPSTYNATGMLLYDTRGNVTVRDNRFFGCKTGCYFYGPSAPKTELLGNRFGNCTWALSVDTSGMTAKGNDFDSRYGVYARGSATLTIDGNRYSDFRGNSGYPSRYVVSGNVVNQDRNAGQLTRGFATPVAINQPQGAGPSDMIVGDFDGDGRLDFATINQLKQQVRFHYGSGGTGFAKRPPRDVPVPGNPIRAVAGEFSGFTGLDLAVLSADGNVRVLSNLGNTGNWNVGPALDLDGEGSPARVASIAAGQLDGAGEDDLVVGYTGDGVNVDGGVYLVIVRRALLGRGPTLTGTTRSVQDVLAVDLDGDKLDDVVAIDTGNLNGVNNAALVWRQGASAGSFLSPVALKLQPDGSRLGAFDLDGDQRPELLVTCSGAPGFLHVFGSQSSGLPQELPVSPWRVAPEAGAVIAGDWQGDSGPSGRRLDVLIAHRGLDRISVLTDFSGGRFTAGTSCVSAIGPRELALGALDSDGRPDLLVLDEIDEKVSVRLAVPLADVQPFGLGCEGGVSGAVPDIYAYGDSARMTLGNPSFGVGIGQARASKVAVLVLGLQALPSQQACSGLVGQLFWLPATITDARGSGQVPIGPIPNDTGLLGAEIIGQFFVLDDLGGLGGAFATSAGLKMRVGG